MQREFLEEDMAQIRRFFPGARSVSLQTPFDLSRGQATGPRIGSNHFRPEAFKTRLEWLTDTASWTSWI